MLSKLLRRPWLWRKLTTRFLNVSRCTFLELPLYLVFIVRGHPYLGPVGISGLSPSTEPAPISSLSFPPLLALESTEFRLALLADYFGICKSDYGTIVLDPDERIYSGIALGRVKPKLGGFSCLHCSCLVGLLSYSI